MGFELRRVRPALLDHYLVNRDQLIEALRAGSWELVEGMSFACEYDSLEQIAEATHERAWLGSGGDEDAPMPDHIAAEISRRVDEMHRAISSRGFFVDPERCFVVLDPSRHAS